MTSKQHAAWIKRGSPRRLARPLQAVRDRLRGYGYTVYDLGNDDHLDHQPPEHHCPFSEVNWPDYVDRAMPDVVTAVDIMPPPAKSGLPSLQQLGAQLFADKQSGAAEWIVDMNWGPSDDRHAVRDTWRPSRTRTSSTDTGHIHLSCRSDRINSAAADDYDPIARLRGGARLEAVEGDDVMYIGLATGERWAVGPSGPVLITWDEWVASFGEKDKTKWPPVLILGSAERVAQFRPAPAPAPAAAAALSAEQLAELVRELRAAMADVEPGLTGDEVEQAVARALAGTKFTTSIAL